MKCTFSQNTIQGSINYDEGKLGQEDKKNIKNWQGKFQPQESFLLSKETQIQVSFQQPSLLLDAKTCPPYLRVGWNILDFLVVSTNLLNLFLVQDASKALKSLKALRALRALRPLRMISRNENLKIVVNALMKAIPQLGNLLIITGIALYIFALLGINFFKGTFYKCSLNAKDKEECEIIGGD